MIVKTKDGHSDIHGVEKLINNMNENELQNCYNKLQAKINAIFAQDKCAYADIEIAKLLIHRQLLRALDTSDKIGMVKEVDREIGSLALCFSKNEVNEKNILLAMKDCI